MVREITALVRSGACLVVRRVQRWCADVRRWSGTQTAVVEVTRFRFTTVGYRVWRSCDVRSVGDGSLSMARTSIKRLRRCVLRVRLRQMRAGASAVHRRRSSVRQGVPRLCRDDDRLRVSDAQVIAQGASAARSGRSIRDDLLSVMG